MIAAACIAGVVSGVPSTVCALLSGDDPLATSLAAGRLLTPRETRCAPLLCAAALVHAAFSLFWAAAVATIASNRPPASRRIVSGATWGLGIAVLDLGAAHAIPSGRLVGVRELPLLPQIMDHALFGVSAAMMLGRRSAAPLR